MSDAGNATELECCDGLNKCLNNWDTNDADNYFYLCLEEDCPDGNVSCSVNGTDPFREGANAKIECCDGLSECKGLWNSDEDYSFLCLTECPDTLSPTASPTASPTTPNCTIKGEDPFDNAMSDAGNATELECCDGLNKCLNNWDTNDADNYFYLCLEEDCPDGNVSCSVNGTDPFREGANAKIECCDGLSECKGLWNSDEDYSFLCLTECPDTLSPTASPTARCTNGGDDPFDNDLDKEIQCCEGYESCLGPWSFNENTNETRFHYLCLEECPSNPPTTPPSPSPTSLAADAATFVPSAEGDCLLDVTFDCHVGTNDTLLCEDFPRPEMSCSECDNNELTFTYNDHSCDDSDNHQGDAFKCVDKPVCARGDEVRVSCVDDEDVVFCNCTVSEGEIVKLVSQTKLPNKATCTVTNVDSGESCQEFDFDPSGETDIMLKDRFGSLTLEGCEDNSGNNNQCLVNAEFKYFVKNSGNKNVVIAEWTRTCSDGDFREFVKDGDALAFEGTDAILLDPNNSIHAIEPAIIDVCRITDLVKSIHVEAETMHQHACDSDITVAIPAPPTPMPSQTPSLSPTESPSVSSQQARTWRPSMADWSTGDDTSEAPSVLVPDEAQPEPSASNCTGINECPFFPTYRECCHGLELCQDDWLDNGMWFYKCVSPDTCHKPTPAPVSPSKALEDEKQPTVNPTSSPASCTEGGLDPWDNDRNEENECCDEFQKCLGPWSKDEDGKTIWHYLCLDICQTQPPAPNPTLEAIADTIANSQQTGTPTKSPTLQPNAIQADTPAQPAPAPGTGKVMGKTGKSSKKGDPLHAMAALAGSGKKGNSGKSGQSGRIRATPPDNNGASPAGTETPKVQRSFAPDVDEGVKAQSGSSNTVLLGGICISLAIVGAVAYRRRSLLNRGNGNTTRRLVDDELNFAVGERDDDDEDHEDANLCDSPNCIICKYRCSPTTFLPPPSDTIDAIDEAIESRSSSIGSNNSWDVVDNELDTEMALGRIEV